MNTGILYRDDITSSPRVWSICSCVMNMALMLEREVPIDESARSTERAHTPASTSISVFPDEI